MSPELAAAVEVVVARTRHERYRELAATSPDYARVILEMAAAPWPPAPAVPPPDPAAIDPLRLARDFCPDRVTCSCNPVVQCRRGQPEGTTAPKTLDDCRACLGL